MASFFTNCSYMHRCRQLYAHKYNQFSLYTVTCMPVFRAICCLITNWCALPQGRLQISRSAYWSCLQFFVYDQGLEGFPCPLWHVYRCSCSEHGHAAVVVRLYGFSFWCYEETQTHRKLIDSLTLPIFSPLPLQHSLGFRSENGPVDVSVGSVIHNSTF